MRYCIWFVFLSSLLLTSCNDHPKHTPNQQRLKLNLYCEPPTLDSRKAVDSTSINVLMMLFEGLTRIGDDHKPIAAIAKEIHISDDQKTYIFHLNDCLWTNGDPVTSHDFVYAWKQILDPKFPADYAQKLYVIKNGQAVKEGKLSSSHLGIEAVDDYTLKVELENPTPYFLELTAFPTFFPIHRNIDQKNPNWSNDAGSDFIGNGPFHLYSWEHENELILEKNPLYWDANQVRLEQIELIMVPDTTTELHMFESNELDWAGSPLSNLPSEVIPNLKEAGKLFSYPVAAVYYYVFNTEHYPFNNNKLRKALGLAINRQEIIDHILQANQMPATGVVPVLHGYSNYSEKPFFKDGDYKQAQTLFDESLKELNLTKETFPKITLCFNTNREHEKIAQAIQNTWQEAFGVRVDLEHFEWKVYLSKIYKHDFHIGRMGWVGDFNDPVSFLVPFKNKNDPNTGGNNATQWENSEYQALLDLAMIENNQKKRMKYLKQAETILIENMPIIPLYFITHCYLKKSYVKNVQLSPLGFADFKKAYIDENDLSCRSRWKDDQKIR